MPSEISYGKESGDETPVPLSHGRILCVENDPAMLRALTLGLEAYHFEVVTAAHGGDALDRFHSYAGKFDAVLTDNNMPEMNGLKLVKFLRALGFNGRILIMSGRLTASDCREYENLGVSGFFQKPCEMSLLAGLLSTSAPSFRSAP